MTQQEIPGRKTTPSVPLDDPAFQYRKSYQTDLTKTFADAREKLRRAKETPCSK